MRKKTWNDKLQDSKDLPKVCALSDEGRVQWHGETMAIPSPSQVNEIMAGVPEGKLITIDGIRKRVAQKNHADVACPLTSGIFAWIAAYAAEERRALGGGDPVPWWRTLKSDGSLNEKWPGGAVYQKALLEAEGHTVVQKGKKLRVIDYEKSCLGD